jgi:hypothetical protein
MSIPLWIKEKLFQKKLIFNELKKHDKNLKWYLDLKRISSQTNSILFDLADHLKKEDWEKMVHTCDGHWSIYGNNIIAKLIEKNFFK